MFKVIAVLISFCSVSAWACPDLSGKYKLEIEKYLEVINVSQVTENNVTTYTIQTDGGLNLTYIADGVTRTTTTVQDGFTNTSEDTITCEGLGVVNRYSETITDENGELVYQEVGRQSMTLNEAGNLIEAGSYSDNKGTSGSGIYEWVRQ